MSKEDKSLRLIKNSDIVSNYEDVSPEVIENFEITQSGLEDNSNLAAVQDIPNTAALDYATTAAKIVTGPLPLVGSVISELVDEIRNIRVSARETKWKKSVVGAFEEVYGDLKDKVSREEFKGFLRSEEFASFFLTATVIAMRNHRKEKLKALRNALVNSVLPGAPGEDLQMFFLSLVDEFTPSHILVLSVYNNYPTWAKKLDITERTALDFSLLDVPLDFASQITDELVRRGLLKERAEHPRKDTVRLANVLLAVPVLTEIGMQFVKFIDTPLKETEDR